MNKREITKVFNEAKLEAFTTLPIVPMELLLHNISDDAAGNQALGDALDLYLSYALTKPALKKVKNRKVVVVWPEDRDEIFPVITALEVFRYGLKKYAVIARVRDGGKPASSAR